MSSAFLLLGMRRGFELPYDYKHTIPIRKDRAKKRKGELQSHHYKVLNLVTAIGRDTTRIRRSQYKGILKYCLYSVHIQSLSRSLPRFSKFSKAFQLLRNFFLEHRDICAIFDYGANGFVPQARHLFNLLSIPGRKTRQWTEESGSAGTHAICSAWSRD